jgi:acyl-CoA synthetase (AMP-forming)/AMP-acid ligase II
LEKPHGLDRGVGRVLPGVEMHIEPLTKAGDGMTDEVGEIWVRSPYLFLGYLKPDGSLDPARGRDGFFATGDLGSLAADGTTLHLGGRMRDIVKKGGYLISLDEIESIAQRHPTVAEAAAVGISHEFYGEDVALYVRFHGEGQEDPVGVLRIWLTENLARFKWPSRITVVDQFPRTSSGKVQKYKLVGGDGA